MEHENGRNPWRSIRNWFVHEAVEIKYQASAHRCTFHCSLESCLMPIVCLTHLITKLNRYSMRVSPRDLLV